VVYGRATSSDELIDVGSLSLKHTAVYEAGKHQFAGDIALSRTGSFGYSVRILPHHGGLAYPSELGLVANA
jgi:starch phosphorylase